MLLGALIVREGELRPRMLSYVDGVYMLVIAALKKGHWSISLALPRF